MNIEEEKFDYQTEKWEKVEFLPLHYKREKVAEEALEYFDESHAYIVELEPEQEEHSHQEYEGHSHADNDFLEHKVVEDLEKINEPGAIIVTGEKFGLEYLLEYRKDASSEIRDKVKIHHST